MPRDQVVQKPGGDGKPVGMDHLVVFEDVVLLGLDHIHEVQVVQNRSIDRHATSRHVGQPPDRKRPQHDGRIFGFPERQGDKTDQDGHRHDVDNELIVPDRQKPDGETKNVGQREQANRFFGARGCNACHDVT